ncbi:MAG TPA: hypothetical protein VFY06_09115, partial [Verrucomicrobiae bacterium]|nr:hypothetical protein [Verrucomicrobiae bacterium]
GHNRIRQVDPYGTITTIAGTNGFGYSGDGMAATNALLYNPSDVALDGYGRVLIADTYNNRIRRFGQGPTLVFDKLTGMDAGDYTLVVSSSYGSVTSSVATLMVLTAPTFRPSQVNGDGSVTLNLSSTPNVSSRLYATTNLTSPVVWQPIFTNPLGGVWQFTDTNAPNPFSRFYRLSTP